MSWVETLCLTALAITTLVCVTVTACGAPDPVIDGDGCHCPEPSPCLEVQETTP